METFNRRALLVGAGSLALAGGAGLYSPAQAWDISKLGPNTLRPGDRGWYVRQLQWALNKVGKVQHVTLDSVYGTNTTKAVRAFQVKQGLYADGIAGSATKRRLDQLLDKIYPDSDGNGSGTRYRSKGVTLRKGPGMSYARVGWLAAGTVVTGEKLSSGWVKISGKGYAWHTYLVPLDGNDGDNDGGNAPDLLQPVSRITPVAKGTVIRPWGSGTRVKLVLKKLGVSQGELSHKMTPAAVSALKRFQARKGLSADGVVGPATWAALGFGTTTWRIDGWQQQPKVGLSASPSARIDAMIAFARAQRGADYTWGGAGPYQYGFDCSGLILQSMYAGGVDPQPIDVHDHQRPGFRTTQNLYAHPRLRKVALSQRKRGDLVWYTNSAGVIQHVAIYLGDGYIVDALYSVRVRRDASVLNGYRRLGTVSRVFA